MGFVTVASGFRDLDFQIVALGRRSVEKQLKASMNGGRRKYLK
jgi:hypothetical protein